MGYKLITDYTFKRSVFESNSYLFRKSEIYEKQGENVENVRLITIKQFITYIKFLLL